MSICPPLLVAERCRVGQDREKDADLVGSADDRLLEIRLWDRYLLEMHS